MKRTNIVIDERLIKAGLKATDLGPVKHWLTMPCVTFFGVNLKRGFWN